MTVQKHQNYTGSDLKCQNLTTDNLECHFLSMTLKFKNQFVRLSKVNLKYEIF